jgi:hypothetical protein
MHLSFVKYEKKDSRAIGGNMMIYPGWPYSTRYDVEMLLLWWRRYYNTNTEPSRCIAGR